MAELLRNCPFGFCSGPFLVATHLQIQAEHRGPSSAQATRQAAKESKGFYKMSPGATALDAVQPKTGRGKRIKAIAGRLPTEGIHAEGLHLPTTQLPQSSFKSGSSAIHSVRPRTRTCSTDYAARYGPYTQSRREISRRLPRTASSTSLGQNYGTFVPVLDVRLLKLTRQKRRSYFFLAVFSPSTSSMSQNMRRRRVPPRWFDG